MKMFLLYSLVCVLMCSNYVAAQTKSSDLENEIKETINQQCIHKVKYLMNHFAEIAKEGEDSIRDYHIEACLDLFVGKGNGKKDYNGNIIIPAPKIEVSSLSTGKINCYSVKDYLIRLKNRLSYSKIVLKTAECYIAGEGIKKIDENKYSARVTYYQVFIGYNGNMIVYHDKTKKTVDVIIVRDNLGRFDILLGDIKVDETTKTDQL